MGDQGRTRHLQNRVNGVKINIRQVFLTISIFVRCVTKRVTKEHPIRGLVHGVHMHCFKIS